MVVAAVPGILMQVAGGHFSKMFLGQTYFYDFSAVLGELAHACRGGGHWLITRNLAMQMSQSSK
jgi:hypothetical protein